MHGMGLYEPNCMNPNLVTLFSVEFWVLAQKPPGGQGCAARWHINFYPNSRFLSRTAWRREGTARRCALSVTASLCFCEFYDTL